MPYSAFSTARVQGRVSLPCTDSHLPAVNDLWINVAKEYMSRGIISLDEVVGLEKEAIINKIIKKDI